jgi:hypothetical protein
MIDLSYRYLYTLPSGRTVIIVTPWWEAWSSRGYELRKATMLEF